MFRYCMFISCLKPVLSEEISMVAELQQLEEVKNKSKHFSKYDLTRKKI